MRRPSGTAAKVALAVGSCALVMVLAELTLPGVLDLEKVTLTYDPLLGFKGRAHLTTPWRREMDGATRIVHTNAHGFHDFERDMAGEPGVHRIIFLGDSFLEAYQVSVADNFSQKLATKLNRRSRHLGVRVEVLNQGVHGYGLGVHYLYIRQRLLDWNPDSVALVLFLGNDLHDNFAPVAASAVPRFRFAADSLQHLPVPEYDTKAWLRDNVLARSTIMRLFWLHVVKANPQMKGMARAMGMLSTPNVEAGHLPADAGEMAAVAAYRLAEIARFLRQRNIPLVVYAIPDPFRVHEVRTSVSPKADGNSRLRAPDPQPLTELVVLSAFRAHGISHVYPRDLFAQRINAGVEVYRKGYGHFSLEGHELSAQLLAPLLWKQLRSKYQVLRGN